MKADPGHKWVPMVRKGTGGFGLCISLLANHFLFTGPCKLDACVSLYNISATLDSKEVIVDIDVVRQVRKYCPNFCFVYDGNNSLFAYGQPPGKIMILYITLDKSSVRYTSSGKDDSGNGSLSGHKRKRMECGREYCILDVMIRYVSTISLCKLEAAMRGEESGKLAFQCLDVILRQHAANRCCLVVRKSFFHDNPRNLVDVGGGVVGCRGFRSSFTPTQGGLSLTIDVTTTTVIKPGPVLTFLLENQNAEDPSEIDWLKARKILKNLRIKTTHNSMEFKIIGLSEHPCNQQYFSLHMRKGSNPYAQRTREVTVYEYFRTEKDIEVNESASLPCISVGRPDDPYYLPIELCLLLPLQRYTKSLSIQQRTSLVKKSRQKPQDRMNTISDALSSNTYHEDHILSACGMKLSNDFVQLQGRVLPPQELVFGMGMSFVPQNGKWNFNGKQMFKPISIEKWAIVNFSTRRDTMHLARRLVNAGRNKGIHIAPPFATFEESPQFRNAPPVVRLDKMIDQLKNGLPAIPEFLLCVLSERKNSCIYGPWKRKNLSELGIVTQCVAPPHKINDQYLTNVLLKINSKLGGINSLLSIEKEFNFPIISTSPTIIFGLGVVRGSQRHSDMMPSIAAVVSSREWPLISRYRAAVRTQSPKNQMIESLFKRSDNGNSDLGIIRGLLIDFFQSSGKRKPENMIIFRAGVSESEFSQVLNIEVKDIIEACEFLESGYRPKITVIVAQKSHRTKFFRKGPGNVPPGTVVDTRICHPRNYDFYMCAHAGMIGTSRPTHYHILMDEIGFYVDDLQMLVHSLSYVNQRSTRATSIVAPISYAHLAAAQMSQFIKGDHDSSKTSGSRGLSIFQNLDIPEMPKLHERVCTKMFFC